MVFKSYKIRLELNDKQRTTCVKHAGTARFVYNYFLNICKQSYEKTKKVPSAIDMHKILVADLKNSKEYSWLKEISKWTPQESLRNLETSYKNFYRKQKFSGYKTFKYKYVNGVKINCGLEGLPQFKKRNNKDSFYLEANIKIKGNKIKVPKLGWLKCSEVLPENVLIKSVTISRTADEWFIAFKTEVTIEKTIKKFDSVGVDLGIKTLATLSNGESFENLKPYKNAKKKLRKQSKEMSRRFVKGAENQSSNYKKSKLKFAKTHQTISSIRKDSIHKITSHLAKNFETVVIEDLNVKGMTKNHKLASAILDGGFSEFKRQLLYKKLWYGGNLIIANTFFPSSKLCSDCGNKHTDLKLSDRVYKCNNCNLVIDRDLNASLNLNKLSLNNIKSVSSTVSAFGDESSTITTSNNGVVQFVDELGNKHQMYTFV